MTPGHCVFLILFLEIELGDESVHGASVKYCRFIDVEFDIGDFFIEALSEFGSLLHLPQVPKGETARSSSCHNVLAQIQGIYGVSGFYH
jgi:hypothetical protein